MSHRAGISEQHRNPIVNVRTGRLARHRRRFPSLLCTRFLGPRQPRRLVGRAVARFSARRLIATEELPFPPVKRWHCAGSGAGAARPGAAGTAADAVGEHGLCERQLATSLPITITTATLSIGDTVDNFSDDGVGAISKTYGVDAFGTVTSGDFTGTVAGAATINDAIAATTSGGTVQILAGTYNEDVNASGNSVTVSPGGSTTAEVTINGNLTLGNNDTLAVKLNGLSPGSQYDQISVQNGSVALSNATLTVTIAGGFTPTQGNIVTPLFLTGSGAITGAFNYTPTGGFQLSTATSGQINLVADHAPVAINDLGSATEAGGFSNSTPGQDASGNVLTNDTDADSGTGDTLSVFSVRTGSSEGAGTSVPLNIPAAVSHGTLTIFSSGSYTYTVNNFDPAVEALRQSSDTLTESFNYTVSDLFGATDIGVLTIVIHGSQRQPRGGRRHGLGHRSRRHGQLNAGTESQRQRAHERYRRRR